ncbi:uncharacterized protein N7479_001169 [Penicillium vulpinum]|nr:uncharacterized protein N7479_001169 [Penicillium vulpinum]KAJ5971251.1 hypothetical protein N7479_001169 [Penicillium vulpinum]
MSERDNDGMNSAGPGTKRNRIDHNPEIGTNSLLAIDFIGVKLDTGVINLIGLRWDIEVTRGPKIHPKDLWDLDDSTQQKRLAVLAS